MTQQDFCSVGFTDDSSEVDEDKSNNKDNGTVGAKEVDAAIPKSPVTDPKDAGIQKQGDVPEAKCPTDPVPERKDTDTAKEVPKSPVPDPKDAENKKQGDVPEAKCLMDPVPERKGSEIAKEVDAAVPKSPVPDPKDAENKKQGDVTEAKCPTDPVPENKDSETAKEVDAAVPKSPVPNPKDAENKKQGDVPEAKHLSDPVPERKDSETAKEVDAAVKSPVSEIKGQSEQMQKEENLGPEMEGTDKQNSCDKDKQERKTEGVEKGGEPKVNVAVKSLLPEIKGQSEQMCNIATLHCGSLFVMLGFSY